MPATWCGNAAKRSGKEKPRRISPAGQRPLAPHNHFSRLSHKAIAKMRMALAGNKVNLRPAFGRRSARSHKYPLVELWIDLNALAKAAKVPLSWVRMLVVQSPTLLQDRKQNFRSFLLVQFHIGFTSKENRFVPSRKRPRLEHFGTKRFLNFQIAVKSVFDTDDGNLIGAADFSRSITITKNPIWDFIYLKKSHYGFGANRRTPKSEQTCLK